MFVAFMAPIVSGTRNGSARPHHRIVKPYDPTDLNGQDADREAQADRLRLLSEVEQLDVKWLMGSKRGRRIVWRLLEQARVFALSFDTNAMRMAFNEGNRNYGNRTLDLIHTTCPELFSVMLKESNDGSSSGGTGNTNNS
jgi:hypothetical protein